MKNKLVALVLGFVMAASVMTGCGSDKEITSSSQSVSSQEKQSVSSTSSTASEEEKEAEPKEIAVDHFAGTTLEIVVVKKSGDTAEDWNDREIFKLAEEATGIHVEWTLIDPAVSKDKIAVMLMSDDQPDVYIGALDENLLSSNLDLFYDLSEEGLLETWAPKVVEDYNSVNNAWRAITWEDGSIRSLITGSFSGGKGDWLMSPLSIRADWLEKIGKEIPTTADELYEVLVAFRDGDMDGDGDPTNEIPMTFCNGHWDGDLLMHANAFGIGGTTWQRLDGYKSLKDGKVLSTMDTDNYRAFLEFYHKLYAEGLLDKEGFSQTADQYTAKRKNTGVLVSYTLSNTRVPFVYQGMEGVEPKLSGLVKGFVGGRTNFCISADSENVEAVLHWWNWLSKDEETKCIARYGSRYFDVIDGKYYIKSPLPEDFSYVGEAMHNYAPAFLPEEGPGLREPNEASRVRSGFIDEYVHLLNQEEFPIIFGGSANAEERAFMEVELSAYIDSFMANAIVNGVTDASWEQYLEGLKTAQYYDWLQWYQDFVDEAASR